MTIQISWMNFAITVLCILRVYRSEENSNETFLKIRADQASSSTTEPKYAPDLKPIRYICEVHLLGVKRGNRLETLRTPPNHNAWLRDSCSRLRSSTHSCRSHICRKVLFDTRNVLRYSQKGIRRAQ